MYVKPAAGYSYEITTNLICYIGSDMRCASHAWQKRLRSIVCFRICAASELLGYVSPVIWFFSRRK